MDAAGIDRACLVGIAGCTENDYIMTMARQFPRRFIPVAGFNPVTCAGLKEVRSSVRQLALEGFPALKLHSRFNDYDPLDPRCLAAIDMAGTAGMAVFFCTLTHQRGRATRHPADIVDRIANTCTHTRIVLLHGLCSGMLDAFELVRMHANLILDLAFTLLRYEGSSLDADMRFLCGALDQRLCFGSDFPEYLPSEAKRRIIELTKGLPEEKRANIFFNNLDGLFANLTKPLLGDVGK